MAKQVNYRYSDQEYKDAYERIKEIMGEEPKFYQTQEDGSIVEIDARLVIEDSLDGIKHLEDLEESRSQYDPMEDMISYNGKI